MSKNKRTKAFILQDTGKYGNNFIKIPIWIYEIIVDHILPVKFEYQARGYKGLRFSARQSEIIFN